ncbi:MAG: hypothetical protein Q8N21_03115 [bacterium]|nr:hypothetical protein [bacterium]
MNKKSKAKSKHQTRMKSRAKILVPKQAKKIQAAQTLQIGKGLDVGTAFIYAAEKIGNEVVFRIERDAFFDLPASDYIKEVFARDEVKYIRNGDQFYVVGNEALRFANLFQRNVRRPLEQGVISPKEKDALPIIKLLIASAVGSHHQAGETVYYSVPAQPIDADFDVLYHQRIIDGFLSSLGYAPKPINEGLAVVFSELAEENFTGLAFSFGGGMVNVCLANLSIPVLSFSVARGGDWIDKQAARAVGEPVSIVTGWKESCLDLDKRENLSRMEQALSIYYDILLDYVVGHLKTELEKSAIHLERPLTIILSGGTAKPTGFLKRFQEALQRFPMPVELGEIRLASQPLHSVTKGALIAAIVDESKKQQKE